MGMIIRNGVVYANGTPGENGKSAYELAVEGGYQGTEAEFKSLLASIPELNDRIDDAEQAIIVTTIGPTSIVTFNAPADGLPLHKLTVQIEPVQSGSGDPSPDNVRRISGWTAVNITRCGKNLFDKFATTPHNGFCVSDYIPVKSGHSYYMPGKITEQNAYYDKNKVGISDLTYSGNIPFVASYDGYIRISLANGVRDTFFVVEGSSGDFIPYEGSTYQITFPNEAGTVYSGTLTINDDGTGELRTRPEYASYNGETLVGPWLSSMDIYSPSNSPTIGAQVVDLGGTESVYTLTAQQVLETLNGTNNIWADCGDVTVEHGAWLERLKVTIDKVNSDLSEKQNIITESGILKGDGTGNVSSATAGTDYATPQQVNNKIGIEQKGLANGVATLDAEGVLPISQLPVNNTIANTTTAWLNEHIIQETGYVIDDSLTVSGAAADAKATGDAISGLKSAIGEIRSNGTRNLCDSSGLMERDGITFSNGVFSGKAKAFDSYELMNDTFEENQSYTASFYGKNTGSTSGYGLGLHITYTNGDTGVTYLPNSTTEFARFTIVSTVSRTISSIKFYYNSGGDNVWEIKDIQIEKGSSATNYVPYYTAYDRLARDAIEVMSDSIESVENLAVQGGEISIDSLTTYQSFDDLPINKIVHLVGNLKLHNAPPGYVDIGHNNMDSGLYQGLVFTYSAKTNRSSIVQKCVYYNNNYDYDKLPRTATRYGFLVNGSITWTDWSVISENTVLHGSDKVVDVNTYSTVTFGDFNDAPPNAIFQVDLNCGNTVLNNPSPGHSGVLMTFAFSPIQQHALVQNHYALENDRICMYIRYGYKQSASEFIWTSWEKVVTEQQL